MKKHFVLSALTLALLSACGGNSDGAVQPPADINGSQTARSSNPSTQQTGNAPQQPGGNTQQAGNTQQNPQQPGNNNQNNQPNNSALTLTTGILSTPVSRNIRDQSNLSVGQIKLPTFAASEHKGGLLIFNNINGKEDLSYNSFQVSDNSYRYIQFGNLNFDQNDERMVFVRGNETTQMPGGGSATYSGDSILNFHNKDEQYLRTETGTMSARADFAKGTLDLSVKTPSHSGSITEAHINGNGFFGADEKKTVIGGNFAGPLAEEIFGSYSHIDQDGSTVWGGFGGKKQ